jgi:N6-L-threonylcarbamoyladenine synthase
VAGGVETGERDGEPVPVPDVAASFQEAVVDVLTRKAVLACAESGRRPPADRWRGGRQLPAAGAGQERCDAAGITLRVPRPGCAPTTARWSPRWAPSWWPGAPPPSSLDLPADSSMPVTDVLAR